MKKLLAILTLMAMLLVSCGGGETPPADVEKDESESLEKVEETTGGLDTIIERGKLIVATSADYPPYEFTLLKDGETEFVGFDMDLAQYIADELGVELEIRDMDFKNVISSVDSGMADLGIAGLSPKSTRDSVLFSDIYYHATHGALIRKADKDSYSSNKDLEGKKIGVQMGSIQEDMANEIADADINALPVITALVQELKTNKVDLIIMEKPVAESYAKNNDDLMLAEGIELVDEESGSAIAIQKGREDLLEKVNEIIKRVQDDGLLDEWIVKANELQEQQGE